MRHVEDPADVDGHDVLPIFETGQFYADRGLWN
jgi:hypothetical protein